MTFFLFQRYKFLWNPKLTLKKKKVLGKGGNGTVDLCCFNDVYFVTKTVSIVIF